MKKKVSKLLVFVLIFSSVLLLCDTTSQAAAKKAKLNMKKLNMTAGSTFCLRVYNLKKKQKVTYTSSNPEVAVAEGITNSGKRATITAQSIGSTTVTATVKKGKKVVRRLKCRVNVSPSGVSIKFLKRTIHLDSLDRFRLTPIIKPNTSTEQPIFESANPFVATVSSSGVVTALAPGVTTITATLLSTNQTAKCTIKVSAVQESEPDEKPKKKKSDSSGDYATK